MSIELKGVNSSREPHETDPNRATREVERWLFYGQNFNSLRNKPSETYQLPSNWKKRATLFKYDKDGNIAEIIEPVSEAKPQSKK